ncbi:hypothetical protein AXF42_Ash010018 [Apostasia shenzhenica]|uniref:Uncharacterized protein n=1 Tax=Apostasia shenzhenica TaxID=1088818 RepID=A0A2I0ACL3_9ASPA|nr:hypothetical protein AXF42_Ash010018 [Apostasia shenzhenica]
MRWGAWPAKTEMGSSSDRNEDGELDKRKRIWNDPKHGINDGASAIISPSSVSTLTSSALSPSSAVSSSSMSSTLAATASPEIFRSIILSVPSIPCLGLWFAPVPSSPYLPPANRNIVISLCRYNQR